MLTRSLVGDTVREGRCDGAKSNAKLRVRESGKTEVEHIGAFYDVEPEPEAVAALPADVVPPDLDKKVNTTSIPSRGMYVRGHGIFLPARIQK